MQGAIWDGEIGRIDEQIENVQEQQKRLGERLDTLTAGSDGRENEGETTFLRGELETLEMEYTRLVLERAEAANKEVQIKILLELVEAMRKEAGAHLPSQDAAPAAGDDGLACYDYDEFFRRTSYIVDEGVIGDDGKIMSFSNDMIVRYLDRVVVNEGDYEVWFKAGVSVKVEK